MFKWMGKLVSTRTRRWMLGIAGGFIVLSGASVEITSRSFFCNSCHIMKPYYASWQDDPHSEVACVQCHIAPGAGNLVHAKLDGLAQVLNDVLHRSATKPSASVSDFACGRSGCHAVELLGKPRNPKLTYHFDHTKHLDLEYLGITVHCTTCHSYIKGDKHFEVNTNACFSCHLMTSYESELVHALDHESSGSPLRVMKRLDVYPIVDQTAPPQPPELPGLPGLTASVEPERRLVAPSSCNTCHTPPQRPFEHNGLLVDHAKYATYDAACNSCHRGVTQPPAVIDDSRCLNCHSFGVERMLPMEELHRVHVEGRHKVECFNCHGLIDHGVVAEVKMLDQFDCRSCHAGQHQVQRSIYLHTPPEIGHGGSVSPGADRLAVSPMFLTHVPCTGCHVGLDDMRVRPGSGAQVARATADACDSCHRPGLGRMQVPLWQRNTRELYDEVVGLIELARRDAPHPQAASLLHEAEQYLEIVRLDGSWGVHNPRYTQYLLETARGRAMDARALKREAVSDE